MTTSSPRLGLTIPNADGSDDADLAALLRALGLDVENLAPGITALTTAARTALTGAAKFPGRTVYDTDDGGLWRTDGTTWRKLAGLDATGALPMAGQKITGLAAGTTLGDAVRFEQVLATSTTFIAGLFSATNPTMDGSASPGTSAQPARSDHAHPSDTTKVSRDGSLAMTGNLPMGANKITGLAAATANGDAVRFEQLNPVHAVGINAGQSIGNNTTVTVSWSSETDPSGCLGSTDFTCPSAGIYVVSAMLYVSNTALAYYPMWAKLQQNGGDVAVASTLVSADLGGVSGLAVSAVLVAAANDTIRLRCQNLGTAGTQSISSGRMSVVRIGGV